MKHTIIHDPTPEQKKAVRESREVVCDMELTVHISVDKEGVVNLFSRKNKSVATMEEFHALPPREKTMHEACARILAAMAREFGEPKEIHGKAH